MVSRIVRVGVALLLGLPLVRFATDEWGEKPQVDFQGAAWAARQVDNVPAWVATFKDKVRQIADRTCRS